MDRCPHSDGIRDLLLVLIGAVFAWLWIREPRGPILETILNGRADG